jgi:uncharacterized cupredoxin-like copper-binding protein
MRFGLLTAPLVLAVATQVLAAGSHEGAQDNVGEPGERAHVTRTIKIDMSDNMRFNPARLSIKQGETIRFVVQNSGKIKHEMVLGTPEELKEHYAMMMKMPGMEHADANKVSVDPGQTGEIVWRFSKTGKVDFACLQPGHYDAGMKGLVTVARGGAGAKSAAKGGDKH